MSMRHLLSAGALALGVLSVAPATFAGPPGHPFERKPVPAPTAPAPQAKAANCDCTMMSDHREPQNPGTAG